MTFDRKRYAREYAKRRRAAKLAAKNAGAVTCQRGLGGQFAVCGGVLVASTDGDGRTAVSCPLCERRRRGVCRDCPAPVAGMIGKAVRCAEHAKIAARASFANYRDDNRKAINRRAKMYARKPAVRAKRIAYKKAWRKAHRDKIRGQKRRANLRGYGRDYQAKRRASGVDAPPTPRSEPRTCLNVGCDIVVTGRKKKCSRCIERERLAALATLGKAA